MLLVSTVVLMAFAGELAAAPVGSPVTGALTLAKRQDITTPLGINITDLGLGDISPIEDGFLEGDSDSGGETNDGGTAVSVANGALGQVGVGQSAQNPNGVEGSSSACSITGCASSSAAANNQSTSSSSASSGLINGGVANGGLINGGVVNLGARWFRRTFRS